MKVFPRKFAATLFLAAAAGSVHAAPDDVFLLAEPTTGEFNKFRLEASYDVVNDTVDIFHLRERQGPVPDNAGNYQGGKLMAGYKFSPYWSGAVTYWRRNIDYGQDTNGIDSWMVALHYDPLAQPGARDRALFRFAVWGDHAGSLSRSAAFNVRNTTLNGIEVSNANDVQAQADFMFSGQVNDQHTLTGFMGLGASRVTIGALNTSVRQGGCNFNVGINSDNIARGTLAAPCQTGSGTVQSASFAVPASQFGIDFNDDFNYTAGYLSTGVSWQWRYGGFRSHVGYQFQYLLRGNVDDRARTYGFSPIKTNHTLGVELSYAVVKNVELFVRGQGSLYNFVGTIPFLYNAATAGKLDRYYGYASFGVRVLAF